MGILRITMRKTSSQSVSGAFTAPEFTQQSRERLLALSNREARK
jgi:hypothetical protein